MNKLTRILVIGAGMLSMATAMPVMAQAGGDQGGPPGGGQGGQRPNFQQMRERRMEQIKEQLSVADDEWAVLKPKIEKVQQLQMESMMSRMGGMMGGMMGGRRGQGGQGGPPGGGQGGEQGGPPGGGPGGMGGLGGMMANNPIAEKVRDLQTTVSNQNASEADIKAKLDALREARKLSQEEMTKAQTEVRELVTVRQEAVLVTLGVLD